jgi:hypothetical protein
MELDLGGRIVKTLHIKDASASSPARSLYFDEIYSTTSVLSSGSWSISNVPSLKTRLRKVNGAWLMI